MALTAAVMADKSRSRMLCALMDGRAWTATELSAVADVSASTASAHLARLCEQRFVVALAQGRHRYFRLAGTEIAELLERLMGVAWATSTPRKITTPLSLRHARTCYDHLAGEVAVMLFDTLVARQWLTSDGETLTKLGQEMLTEMGIVLAAGSSRRKFSCGCLVCSAQRFCVGFPNRSGLKRSRAVAMSPSLRLGSANSRRNLASKLCGRSPVLRKRSRKNDIFLSHS